MNEQEDDLTDLFEQTLGHSAAGPWLPLARPVSFWGGLAEGTGQITDPSHPQYGEYLIGQVVWLPGFKGSTAGSGALLEAIASRSAPRAILTPRLDLSLVSGVLAAKSIGCRVPLLARIKDLALIARLQSIPVGRHVRIEFETTLSDQASPLH